RPARWWDAIIPPDATLPIQPSTDPIEIAEQADLRRRKEAASYQQFVDAIDVLVAYLDEEQAPAQADLWIDGKAAERHAGITAANVGRNAGPEGSGKPILDNGKTGAARRYYKPSVADFRAER